MRVEDKMSCKDCKNYKTCALERRGICTDFEKKEGEEDDKAINRRHIHRS